MDTTNYIRSQDKDYAEGYADGARSAELLIAQLENVRDQARAYINYMADMERGKWLNNRTAQNLMATIAKTRPSAIGPEERELTPDERAGKRCITCGSYNVSEPAPQPERSNRR